MEPSPQQTHNALYLVRLLSPPPQKPLLSPSQRTSDFRKWQSTLLPPFLRLGFIFFTLHRCSNWTANHDAPPNHSLTIRSLLKRYLISNRTRMDLRKSTSKVCMPLVMYERVPPSPRTASLPLDLTLAPSTPLLTR
jgi:hypothetical protein